MKASQADLKASQGELEKKIDHYLADIKASIIANRELLRDKEDIATYEVKSTIKKKRALALSMSAQKTMTNVSTPMAQKNVTSSSWQNEERLTQQQLFTKTRVNTNSKHWMPFGCPVYVLEDSLQGSGIHHKWKTRARVGIYLGRSPQHGQNVVNVLSRTTGLVSPRFHVTFDPIFHTVKQDYYDALWQIKTGFVNQKGEAIKPIPKRGKADSEGARASKRQKLKGKLDRVKNDSRTDDPQLQQTDEISPHQGKRNLPPSLNNNGQGNDPRPREVNLSFENQVPTKNSEPTQNLINVMKTELTMVTAEDVPGETYCLEAMFPNYAGEREMDPLTVLRAHALHGMPMMPFAGAFYQATNNITVPQQYFAQAAQHAPSQAQAEHQHERDRNAICALVHFWKKMMVRAPNTLVISRHPTSNTATTLNLAVVALQRNTWDHAMTESGCEEEYQDQESYLESVGLPEKVSYFLV
jgi:hypothetical protein